MKSQNSSRSNMKEDEKGKNFLPKINDSNLTTENGQVFENPFYIPPDEEIFKWKTKERDDKYNEKAKERSLRIWDKGLQNKGTKMRDLLNIHEIEDEEEDKDGKINIVEAAKSAIKNRVRHKEPMPNFIQKKREMFLFQMSINQKKEQIKEFEELAHLQEIGLQKAMQMLEKDADTFKKFVEENKTQTRVAIRMADEESKYKQTKMVELKNIQENVQTVSSKNTKQLEKLEKLFQYKIFLDELTPQEYLEKERKKITSKDTRKNHEEHFDWTSYNIQITPELKQFLNQEDDHYEMYFKNPEQLQKVFESLEGKNLFTIKTIRESEQELDQVKRKFSELKHDLLEKKKQLAQNKHDIEKAIDAKLDATSALYKSNKKDDFANKPLNKLKNAIQKIYQSKEIFGDSKTDHNLTEIEILKEIEIKIEAQIKEMRLYKASYVHERYKECYEARRKAIAEEKKIKERFDQEQRLKELQENRESTKRLGRPIMFKIMLNTDKQETQVKDTVNEEQLRAKMLFDTRFNV